MVVSASPFATDVGTAILAAGGNAVDAAVGTAFALSVVEPTMSGLGGRTQMLIHTAEGEFVGLDGGTEVPRATPPDLAIREGEGGYRAIGIPGTVAVLATALERFGRMTLPSVLSHVLPLAEAGFPLSASEAARIAEVADELHQLSGSREHFFGPDGNALGAGETLRQPALGRILRAIADGGPEVFYRGWIAESIATDMSANGAFLTAEDLATYEVIESIVVRGRYRMHDVIGTYLPASGATTIEALQILERLDPAPVVGSAPWVQNVAHALLASFEDRVADLGPPEQHAAVIVSAEWADRRADEIRAHRGEPPEPVPADSESPFTTHLSVVDAAGGAVALTQSVGPNMGSKVVTEGLGFVYAATMGYLGARQPGDRPFSSQSPIMILDDGDLILVLGASGARRIISSLVSTVSRVVDGGVELTEAVMAPRFHPSGPNLYVESRTEIPWSTGVVAELSRTEFDVVERSEADYFAAIHGIVIDPTSRVAVGVAEPRRDGSARGIVR
jgi:gamma-glutamyltranspeptidase/glutathione hydrolase